MEWDARLAASFRWVFCIYGFLSQNQIMDLLHNDSAEVRICSPKILKWSAYCMCVCIFQQAVMYSRISRTVSLHSLSMGWGRLFGTFPCRKHSHTDVCRCSDAASPLSSCSAQADLLEMWEMEEDRSQECRRGIGADINTVPVCK